MRTPKPGVVDIHGKQYQTVQLRIHQFRLAHPISEGWSLLTELVECSEKQVICRATIVDPQGKTVASGLAHEIWTASKINKTSCVENCETSAWGRCLANAGLGGEEFPVVSADEMQVAMEQQAKKPKSTIRDHVYGCKEEDQLYEMLCKWEEKKPVGPDTINHWVVVISSVEEKLASRHWAPTPELSRFCELVRKNADAIADEEAQNEAT